MRPDMSGESPRLILVASLWIYYRVGRLIDKDQASFLVRGVTLNCPNCRNEVFVNLEDGSSQCTRCGWIAQLSELPVQAEKNKHSRTER
jgi:ribosomal protein S27AE